MIPDFDMPELIIAILLLLLIVAVGRSMYLSYKKARYKRKNHELKDGILDKKKTIKAYQKQIVDIESLKKEIEEKQLEIVELKKELKAKHQDITTLGQTIHHQTKAFEKYADYKNVEANNTRLGAHFIKNVISQIYEDLENAQSKYKNFLGVHYKIGKSSSGIPPIKALKDIFRLLDYNVASLHQTKISINRELEYVEMFLDLIRYLKPNAKIELVNHLNEEQRNTLEIKPTLFFPFIENALKHGSLNTEASFISIKLQQTAQHTLNYCLVNSVEQPIREQLSAIEKIDKGFGLNALEQLLHTYYPGSSLTHQNLPNNQYMSELILTLNQ